MLYRAILLASFVPLVLLLLGSDCAGDVAANHIDLRYPLAIPVSGVKAKDLRDNFGEARGTRKHEAVDILAPRGTPVIAVADGSIEKLFRSVPGGLTIYQFDNDGIYCFYYAHLDRYAAGVMEGMAVRRGDVIGYVGTTGNVPPNAPHLHFAITKLGPEKRWWKGEAINP